MIRGQMSITTIIFAVLTLVVFLAMLPVINTVIGEAEDSGDMDTMTSILVKLFPLVMILCIIAGVVFYAQPHYPQR